IHATGGKVMIYQPDENRYHTMEYRRCGRSGVKLPAISLGLWHAELVGHADYRKTRELIISRIGDNDNITAIHWSIDSQ
ncbi:hypothetical protein ONO39_26565, partial [Salmonella enterica subsp. enterica serovar Anatum]|nr:hypothetical protein [Salmonella enterica subsp. enterica serovar Anatum]